LIRLWANAIFDSVKLADDATLCGIGIAIPGPFDYENGISKLDGSNGKFGQLYNVNVRDELQRAMALPPSVPIRFINDATAFAIGEGQAGVGVGLSKFIALTMGTGLGSAFIADGLPVVNDPSVPHGGCVWHLPFRSSTVDDYFSTRGLISRYYDLSSVKVGGVKEIAERGEDLHARAVFDDWGKSLAEMLLPWCDKFHPNGLIIGGNISRAYHLFGPKLESTFNDHFISCQTRTSQQFEISALVGASLLTDMEYYESIHPLLKYLI
jgi:glucokinase